MEKIYFGDDKDKAESESIWDKPPKTVDDLKKAVAQMDVFTDFEQRGRFAIVRVPDSTGTSLYLSKGGDNIFWLNKYSHKQERRGTTTLYHFKF